MEKEYSMFIPHLAPSRARRGPGRGSQGGLRAANAFDTQLMVLVKEAVRVEKGLVRPSSPILEEGRPATLKDPPHQSIILKCDGGERSHHSPHYQVIGYR